MGAVAGRGIALWGPSLVLLGLVFALPLGESAWASLHRLWLQLPDEAPFVGLENYRQLVTSPRFWRALGRTAGFAAASVALEAALGVGLALLMHGGGPRARALARTTALLPWALPTAVSAVLWAWILHDRHGVANHLLLALGAIGAPLVWLGEPTLAMASILVADVWKTTPFVALIALAGLQTIDPRVYEAAALDGASRFQAFRRVTLPLLRPALVVAVLFRAVEALRIFDLVYVLTRGGPGGSTETVSVLTYLLMFQELDMGQASAAGLLTAAVAGLVAAALLGTQARAERA